MGDLIIGRDESDIEKYGDEGTIFIGKQYIKMGKTVSLANKVKMDIARPHVILITGKRGEGKSYTLAQFSEGISEFAGGEVSQNIAPLFFDTMGIFWTLKFPNYRDESLLHEWGMKPHGIDNVKLFVPKGKFEEMKEAGIPVDEPFSLTTSNLSQLDWCMVFNIDPTEPVGILIGRAINDLEGKYELEDIIQRIKKDDKAEEHVKNAAITKYQNVKEWGLFSKEGTEVEDVLEGGEASILDVSMYSHLYGSFSIRALVIGLFCKELLEKRETARKLEEMKTIRKGFSYFASGGQEKEVPLAWIFIDEVHEFLPPEGETLATGPLLQIIREGRQPGISLVVATQQPGKMNPAVLSQSDMVISHRVTSEADIDALNSIMQTYMAKTLSNYIDDLPKRKGTAIVLDQNQERVYPIQMRPRFSWHGGETPSAIPPKKKEI